MLPTGLQRLDDLEFDLTDARCVGMDQYVGHSALLCGSEVCLVHDTEAGTINETGFPKNNHSGGAMAVYKRMEEIMFVGGDNDNTTEFYNPVADDWVLFGAEFPASSIRKIFLTFQVPVQDVHVFRDGIVTILWCLDGRS